MQVKEAIYARRAIKQFDPDHKMTPAEEQELLYGEISPSVENSPEPSE